jgi:hypothetical protein
MKHCTGQMGPCYTPHHQSPSVRFATPQNAFCRNRPNWSDKTQVQLSHPEWKYPAEQATYETLMRQNERSKVARNRVRAFVDNTFVRRNATTRLAGLLFALDFNNFERCHVAVVGCCAGDDDQVSLSIGAELVEEPGRR